MWVYQHSPGVNSEAFQGRITLSTPQGGRVAVDARLLELWQQADGQSLDRLLVGLDENSSLPRRAALGCLAEAGFLERREAGESSAPPESPSPGPSLQPGEELVSVIVVSYHSREWLPALFASLQRQTHQSLELILIDNGSGDGSLELARQQYPSARSLSLAEPVSLAQALNRGADLALGDYLFFLNPDVVLEPDAIEQLVQAARGCPGCAAVAPKLKLLWSPAFLNGLGNFVGAFSWGVDLGLGHLDLGQFDHWQEVPSACFAAALVSVSSWNRVGALDEGFPLYYEDSEWSYRARLLGMPVWAAPQAVVYHAFSGRPRAAPHDGLDSAKLERVIFGRLRFASKTVSASFLPRFILLYLLEDALRLLAGGLRIKGATVRAILSAWGRYLRSLPQLRHARRALQARRKISDRELFALQRQAPAPLIRYGLPQLTWDIISRQYLPLLASGAARSIPEFAGIQPVTLPKKSQWERVQSIGQHEGLAGALHFLWRQAQRKLMQP